MANSYVEYTTAGTGINGLGQATFTAPTKFLSINDIRAKGLNGSTWTELTISSRGTNTVTLSAVPSAYSKVRIYRATTSEQIVDFQSGARLSESDLDTAYNQGLYVAQEVSEDAGAIGTIINLANTSGIQNSGTITTTNLTATGTVSLPNGSISNNSLAGSIPSSKLAGGITNTQLAGSITNDKLAGSIDLTSKVTGVLPVANGGTGTSVSTASPAGSVLETFSLPCKGQSITVGSGSYTLQNVTQHQTLDTTYQDVTGSSITYTPPATAQLVMYSLSFCIGAGDSEPITSMKLFLDSDEVTAARTTYKFSYDSGRVEIKWGFKIGGSADTSIGQVATWSTAKTIKLQARNHSGSYEGVMHKQYHFDGGQGNNLSIPVLTITAIK